MTNRNAALMVWGLPILGTILIGVGWYLVAHGLVQSGIAVFVAAMSALILAATTYVRNIYWQQTTLRIGALVGISFLFSFSLGFAVASIYDMLPSNRIVFVATATNSVFFNYRAGSRGPLSPMVYVVQAPGQREASSINLLVYLTLDNVSDKSKIILGYGLEISPDSDGPWVKMCSVNVTDAGKIYWITIAGDGLDLERATLLSSESMMDPKITEKVIGAYNAISGWTAWEYPDFNNYFPAYGRISMVLASGERFKQVIPINAETGVTLSGARLRFPPPAKPTSLSDAGQLLPCRRTMAMMPP